MKAAWAFWRGLRPAQWLKNLFVLVTLVFAHLLFDRDATFRAMVAALLFCLVSSSSYLLNDIHDREQDRLHPDKSRRPLVTGDLRPSFAWAGSILLLLIGLCGGWWLNGRVAAILAGYWILNLAYTWVLKHHAILDVVTITAGFILRVAAGAAAISIGMSHWLVLCSTLLALFLVLGKRRQELAVMKQDATGHRLVLGSYTTRILDIAIVATGIAAFAGYTAYTFLQEIHPRALVATSPFVAFGIARYFYLVIWKNRGGDPAHILLTDLPVLGNLLLWFGALVWIIYGS